MVHEASAEIGEIRPKCPDKNRNFGLRMSGFAEACEAYHAPLSGHPQKRPPAPQMSVLAAEASKNSQFVRPCA